MKTLSIQMSVVQNCSVSECVYNAANGCHAKAITIGDMGNPACDTALCLSVPAAGWGATDPRPAAGVGACKVDTCRHNQDYECTAEEISVGHRLALVHCLTYAAR
jgi:hypothetical protein